MKSTSGAMRIGPASWSRSAPGTTGIPDKRQVHLGERALGPIMQGAPAQLRGQGHRIAEREGGLGIDARHDDRRVEARPSARRTPRAVLPSVDISAAGRRGDDGHSGRLRRRAQRLGERAGAAARPDASPVASGVVGGVEQKQQAAARRPRAEHRSRRRHRRPTPPSAAAVSACSATRSATGIGPQRSNR